jgi:hypothetical protein
MKFSNILNLHYHTIDTHPQLKKKLYYFILTECRAYIMEKRKLQVPDLLAEILGPDPANSSIGSSNSYRQHTSSTKYNPQIFLYITYDI